MLFVFCQAEEGIRDVVRSRGLGDVYKRQGVSRDRARRFVILVGNRSSLDGAAGGVTVFL